MNLRKYIVVSLLRTSYTCSELGWFVVQVLEMIRNDTIAQNVKTNYPHRVLCTILVTSSSPCSTMFLVIQRENNLNKMDS